MTADELRQIAVSLCGAVKYRDKNEGNMLALETALAILSAHCFDAETSVSYDQFHLILNFKVYDEADKKHAPKPAPPVQKADCPVCHTPMIRDAGTGWECPNQNIVGHANTEREQASKLNTDRAWHDSGIHGAKV